MAIVNGTRFKFYVNGSLIAGSTSASISTSMSVRDATSKDSGGWSESLEGLREWSADGEGFFNPSATFGFDELFAFIESRAVITVRISTETSGESYFQGTAFLTDLSTDAPVEDSMTFSYSVTGTGPLAYIALT